MGIMVDGVHVGAASYAKAKTNVEASAANDTNELLAELKQNLGGLNIVIANTGNRPNTSGGLNNVSIAPNILRKMADDPEERLKYESLLYDVQDLVKNDTGYLQVNGHNTQITHREYFIDSDGELGVWTSGKTVDSNSGSIGKTMLPKDDKESWLSRLMESLEKKRVAEKEEARRLKRKERTRLNYGGDNGMDVSI